MNEIIDKNKFFTNFKLFFKNNYKYLILLVFLIFFIMLSIQIYYYLINKKVLQNSIDYDLVINNTNSPKYIKVIEELSGEKNFYGTLSLLENIKILISQNQYEKAYDRYIDLLNNKELNNLYKN